jgi:hypothetical protein
MIVISRDTTYFLPIPVIIHAVFNHRVTPTNRKTRKHRYPFHCALILRDTRLTMKKALFYFEVFAFKQYKLHYNYIYSRP